VNPPIFHLASVADAQLLKEHTNYHTASLDTEGFIHCCTEEQLPGVIQRYYSDAVELVILHIDTERLEASLVFENTVGGTELFPHIYGEINPQAVLSKDALDREDIVQIATSGDYNAPQQRN